MEMAREMQKSYVHFGMRSPRLLSNPEEYVIKKDMREKMAEELSDDAIVLGYELMEEPETIHEFFKNQRGKKIDSIIYKGITPLEQKGVSRRMLSIYLRRTKGMTCREANRVVAELFCWMYAIINS